MFERQSFGIFDVSGRPEITSSGLRSFGGGGSRGRLSRRGGFGRGCRRSGLFAPGKSRHEKRRECNGREDGLLRLLEHGVPHWFLSGQGRRKREAVGEGASHAFVCVHVPTLSPIGFLAGVARQRAATECVRLTVPARRHLRRSEKGTPGASLYTRACRSGAFKVASESCHGRLGPADLPSQFCDFEREMSEKCRRTSQRVASSMRRWASEACHPSAVAW